MFTQSFGFLKPVKIKHRFQSLVFVVVTLLNTLTVLFLFAELCDWVKPVLMLLRI